MKPNYCTNPNVESCIECNLTNYGLDCHNNPLAISNDHPSKYQQVMDHPTICRYTPSEKIPHINALKTAGLLDELTVDQLAQIVVIAQFAYRDGQRSQGAEKIDNDAVWLDGIGGIEKQPDGTWKLTMPDKPNAIASALGSIKTDKKAAASRENGKKGGRPRKEKI